MARTCTVCSHPDRHAIDMALAAGEAVSDVAARYRTKSGLPLGRMAVYRHKDEHLPKVLVQAAEATGEAQAIDVVQQLRAINAAALAVLKQARDAGQGALALMAIDRIHRQIELQAKLLGDLDERPQVTLTLSPQWLSVRACLIEALAPYPEARSAVAARLRALEAA